MPIYDLYISLKGMFRQLAIYGLHDVIEIFFLSLVIYCILSWLQKDNRKLLNHFYLYCFIFFFSYFGNFPIISVLLIYGSPALAMCMILIHQRKIQEHFVTVKRKFNSASHDWIHELLQATLIAKNKNIICSYVIERDDTLENFVDFAYLFDTLLNRYTLVSLIESPYYCQKKLIWCNANGRILSINTRWKEHNSEFWFTTAVLQEEQWKQDAIFYTTQFDCIVFKPNKKNHSFDVIINGAIAENLSSTQLAHLLYTSFNIPNQKRSTFTELKDQNEIIFKKPHQNEQLL